MERFGKYQKMNDIADDFTVEYDECMDVSPVYFTDFILRAFTFKKLHRIFIIFVERI